MQPNINIRSQFNDLKEQLSLRKVEEKPVRIIPGPAGIVQVAKLRKQSDIHEGGGGDESVLSTLEYIRKVVDDVGEDEDFKGGSWFFPSKPSMHYLNITIRNMVKVFHKNTVPGNGSGIGRSRMLMEIEEIVKLMEEEEMSELELQDRMKLEALGERGDAVRCLDHIREIIAMDSVKLEVLEQVLAGTHVGIGLKDSYVADMEENE
ncbi:hypothetical protein Tco_1371539 [Tanacetum coccineum]